ncbi:nephrin-like isoform X2 [Adelges cooleyi]|uniref:nephrin-like isoform X2 n=1 Tax=Adelges cooleyi TaxID=133065 RepID=UPI0021803EDA|nr:nephrin-like isoform X2 [Adelges cooleyi]
MPLLRTSGLLLFLLLLLTSWPRHPLPVSGQGPVRPVFAVVHGTASLPCDITPPIPHDPLDTVILVVWYKNEKTAIYSVDIRGKHIDPTKSHWKDEMLEGRSHFRTLSEPATLSIDNVSEMDAGVYRCRVDFKKSPTRNTRLNLTVIVPPRRPSIQTEKGEEIQNMAGPYFEGDRVKLTCIVTGGQPEPSVRWWRGETLVDSGSGQELSSKYFSTSSTTFRHNQLTIDSLTRDDQGAVYTCQASNSNLSAPVSASVTIEMYLKPLKVEVLSSRQPLSAGRSYEVQCQSTGSKPPANITWWKDNEKLANFTQTVSVDGQVTSSTLVFRPEKTDNGKSIVCRAENEHVQQEVDGTYGAEEDSWTIDVHFVPLLKLALGINMNPTDIEEGDDVYFECKIDSNPPAYKVVWKHNGQVVQGNVKGGVIMNQKDLALQNVKRQQAGNYSCLASNVEGDGESNIVRLTVMYKPVCKNNQKLTYGVARNENTEILCEVDAYPAPDVFKWTFNRTGAVASDVAGNDIMTQQSRFGGSGLETSAIRKSRMSSVLNYSPLSPSSGIGGGGVNDGDYGTVTCRATNSAGQQLEPCVFHVIAAVKPDPPFNCTTSERTPFSMRVWCAQGFDGGVTQKFTLEAYDAGNDLAAVVGDGPTVAADGPMPPLLFNMSADEPEFIIRQLTPAAGLRLAVYAHNSRGTSERTWLTAYTLNAADKQTTSGSSVAGVGAGNRLRLTPIVATLVGITIVAAAIAAVVMCALRMRSHRDRIRRRQELCGDNGCIVGTGGGSAAIAVGKQKVDGNNAAALDSDKNPDIIPPTKIKNSNRNNIGYHPVQQQMDSNVDIDVEALENETSDDERAGYPVDQIDGISSRHSMNTLRRAAAPTPSGYSNVGYRPEQHNMATTSVTTRLPKYHHREIVTVRTPLMSSQQESCV